MKLDPEKTISTTARVARLYRLGTRRLARAHLALQRRPAVGRLLQDLSTQIASAMGAQLGCPVELGPRLLDTTVTLDKALAKADQAALVLLSLDALDAPAVLELERPVLNAALERLSGGSAQLSPVTRLTRIEEAAFGFVALIALQAARANEFAEQRFAARLVAVNALRPDALAHADGTGSQLCLQLSLAVGETQGQARLFVPARAVQAAVQGDPAEPPSELSPELAEAALPVRTFAGRAQLHSGELGSLARGDVVMFEQLGLEGGELRGGARLSTRGFDLIGSFGPDGFHLTRVFARVFPQESSMSRSIEKEEAPTLPVEVEIELTRLRLTLRELSGIRPGTILPLHINSAEPVVLRVGDRAVARAELVEIEGEVGARILTLLS